ncbi:MAG: TonB-dependent receptor plug domain-containing protein, partial [Maribacter sp.]|nr:TonB-dependent receptor plug domain-containing protein [Maribacter sp.]
ELDSLIAWQERILIHVDKSIIAEDTPLYFKAYNLTGPNRVRATLSKVLKVELMNDQKQPIAAQYYKIDNGMSSGAFVVPKKLGKGSYTLRAYTRWMQNYGESFYCSTKLQLGSSEVRTNGNETIKKPLAVSFHPEGGTLIANLNNRLLIKTTSALSAADGIIGEIIDSNNNTVASARAFGPEVMSAIFIPKTKESYTLKTNNGFTYPLPTPIPSGCILSVNNLDTASLRIRIQATSEFINSKVWLKGEMSGVTYIKKELELQTSTIVVNVPKQGIPFGVLTLSIHDNKGGILAKRPVFIDSKKDLKLSISQLGHNNNRDELAFKIRVTDANGKPVATEVSLSATNGDSDPFTVQSMESNTFNWELDELAKNTGQLGRIDRYINDLGLLTSVDAQNDMISQGVPDRITYPFQQGLNLFGYAYNLNNQLLKNTKIQVLWASGTDVIVQEIKSDDFGRIRLENLQFVGETKLVFRTVGNDTSSRLVKVVPIQESYETKNISKSMARVNSQKHGREIKASTWEPIENEKRIELKEVEVTEYKTERKRAMPAVYGLNATRTRTVIQDLERPKRVFQLLQVIPGIMVKGDLDYPTVSMLAGRNAFGTSPVKPASALDQPGPLWVLDGFILENSNNFKPEWGISMLDIDRIELLPPAEASIYGSRAARGVFMVYTRNGSDYEYVNRKEGQLNFQGYAESPTFKSHLEKMIKRPKKYQDGVNTLFWDPSIKTNDQGEAIVRFKVPFAFEKIALKASTVTELGGIGSTKLVIPN